VLDEGRFHLERADAVARALDDVVVPADEPEIAVVVHAGLVPGIVEPVHERLCIRFWIVEVLDEEPHGGAGRA